MTVLLHSFASIFPSKFICNSWRRILIYSYRYLYFRRRWLLPIIFFSITTILIFLPAILYPSIFESIGGDVYHNLWIWGRNISNIKAGVAPYEPNIYYPDPLSSFYSELESGNSFMYGLLSSTGMHPFRAYMIIFVLSYIFTGVGFYTISMLAGASTTASLVGASLATFTAYRYTHFPHAQLLAMHWMLAPLACSLAYLLTSKRWILVPVFLSHIPVLCGPSYNLTALVFLEGAIFICFVTHKGLSARTKFFQGILLCGAVVLAALPSIPVWLGYFRLFLSGFVRDNGELHGYRIDLTSFFTPVNGSLLYNYVREWLRNQNQARFLDQALFAGITASFLMFRSAITNLTVPIRTVPGEIVRGPYRSCFKYAAIVMAALALGETITWHGWYVVPNPVFRLAERARLLSATRYITHYGYLAIAIMSIPVSCWLTKIFKSKKTKQRICLNMILAGLIIVENFAAYTQGLAVLPPKLKNGIGSLRPGLHKKPPVYDFLKTLPAYKAAIFFPIMEEPIQVNDVYFRQFEYIFYASEHRLRIVNGISGFFPPEFHKSLAALEGFPSRQGLAFVKEKRISYLIYDRRPVAHPLPSEVAIKTFCDCFNKLYSDKEYEVYQVNFTALQRCLM